MKTQYYTATSLDGFIAQVGALAMGSTTYERILRHADKGAEKAGSAWPYTQPAWVFTHRELPRVERADIRFVQGSVKEVHAEMSGSAGSKNIWVVGGGDLAGQFHDAGLLDEAIIQVASVTLGKGKQLFPRRVTSPPWQLLSVRQIGPGFAELRYRLPSGRAASAA